MLLPFPLPHPAAAAASTWVDRYENDPRKGSDILVQALEREGVEQVGSMSHESQAHENNTLPRVCA